MKRVLCTVLALSASAALVVAGPFYDAKDSTLAITGGTGRYRDARGTMELHARSGATEFAFVFHVDD